MGFDIGELRVNMRDMGISGGGIGGEVKSGVDTQVTLKNDKRVEDEYGRLSPSNGPTDLQEFRAAMAKQKPPLAPGR